MNERIKELAEQAASNYTQNFNWEYLQQIDKDIFEKFAEMIINECATICKDTADKQFNPMFTRIRQQPTAAVCYKKIKQHFGVE